MKHKPSFGTQFFFTTPPLPCPYLAGRIERRVMTELVGRAAADLHDALSLAGYRRSHRIAYTPACPDCSGCVAVRAVAGEFAISPSLRRVWKRNDDIKAEIAAATATNEQFALFTAYLNSRHGDGEMAKMDFHDYRELVEDTPVDTFIVEFRKPGGRLAGVCLADRIVKGLSAVYSFFDPALRRRSLGSYMILSLLEQAKTEGLAHVYLGYWVASSSKMAYKARFRPLEAHTPEGWRRHADP
ncbi:MAG TPA: arginyltransferase [Rhodospirillales bacterium]|jgi:arginine-tRNA-protein transferase|nr:arginyltransferase [Rhodospirillales bacterium]